MEVERFILEFTHRNPRTSCVEGCVNGVANGVEGFEQDPEFVVQWVTTLLFNAGFCLPTYATTQMVKITLTHLQGQTKRGNILDIFNTTAEDLDTENKFPHSIVTPPDNCVQCGTKLTFERSRA
eukprot:8294548-Pyramimonas_sp.AAC.1